MKQRGFNLIELMIVVAIIGIIAGIAIPNYQKNILKSARSEGMTELLDIMRAQENFFANGFTYTDDLRDLNYSNPRVTANGRYSIAAGSCGTDALTECVRLTATATGGQEDDGNLTLDSRGNRTHRGNAGWVK